MYLIVPVLICKASLLMAVRFVRSMTVICANEQTTWDNVPRIVSCFGLVFRHVGLFAAVQLGVDFAVEAGRKEQSLQATA